MTGDRQRVVHYTRFHAEGRWGGREQVVDQYCQGLARHGFDSEIYATSAFSQPGEARVHEVLVRRFDYFYPYFPMSTERRERMDTKGGNPLSPGLLAALRAHPPDIVHLHNGARLGAQVLRFCQSRRIPVVYSLHGGHFVVPESEKRDITSGTRGLLDWGKVVGWWAGARSLESDVDALLCVGNNEYLAARERGQEHAHYLPNGVDEERFGRGDGERFRQQRGFVDVELALCCGRIDTQKNQVGFVRDLGPLLRSRPKLQLLLIGSTTNRDYHDRVLAEIKEQGVAEQVHLLGNLDPKSNDLADAYAACDVFVLPSVAEPFGIVILEAWAARRPVVASNVDGIPHFVTHGENGLLVDPHSDGDIRGAVERVLDNGELAVELGARGRAAVEEQFTWRAITGRLAELYRQLLAGKK